LPEGYQAPSEQRGQQPIPQVHDYLAEKHRENGHRYGGEDYDPFLFHFAYLFLG
jgi:hypothetical protein